MERIISFTQSVPQLGLYTRTSTVGAELEMVRAFVDYYSERFLRQNKASNLAVFIEPKIASGFPDVVFASYAPSAFEGWTSVRNQLGSIDLKILSYIINQNGCDGKDIVHDLLFPEGQILFSLEHLLDARLVERKSGTWLPTKMSKVYGVKKLVSIEAKIGNIKKVTEQSYLNTWFASHSYALIDSQPAESTIKNFRESGIGLYCRKNRFLKIVEAQERTLPSSYVSLQFNEWIGRALQA